MHVCVKFKYFIIKTTWLTKYHQGITYLVQFNSTVIYRAFVT